MISIKKLLRIPLLIVVLLLLGAGLVIALNPQWLHVTQVALELNPNSKENTLYERIKTSLEPQLRKLEGQYFWTVSLQRIDDLTLHDRRVKHVAVYREFPSRVRVEIEPYTPVLAYLAGDGRIYPIATDATLLPALGLNEAPDVPLVRGEEFKDEPKLRERAIDLYHDIPEQGALNKKQISEIFYGAKDGFKVYLSGMASEVRLGDTDFGPKVARVLKVLSYLDSQNIKGRVIDARFSKKVVVRVRKAP